MVCGLVARALVAGPGTDLKRRPPSDMRRNAPLKALLFAALLWLAQMQGVMHGISHLGGSSDGRDLNAAHAVVCADCAAYAQAGAAPVPVPPSALLDPPADVVTTAAPQQHRSAAALAPYQSRAPPVELA
jgi:hypothetical protein